MSLQGLLDVVFPLVAGMWALSLIFGTAEWVTDCWALAMCGAGMAGSALQHSTIWLAVNTATALFFVFALDIDLRKRGELKL